MDEEIEHMQLEEKLITILYDWIDGGVKNMTLKELRHVIQMIERDGLAQVTVRDPKR